MATKRVVRTEEEVELTPMEEDQEDKFAEILAELGQGGDVVYSATVHEVPTHANGTAIRGSKEIFIDEFDQTQIPGLAVWLRDNAGTGTYRVRVRENGRIVKSADLRVKKLGADKPAPGNDNTQMMEMLRDVLKQQNERMEKLEEKLSARPQEASEIERLKSLSEIFKNMQPPAAPVQTESTSIGTSLGLITTVLTLTEKLRGDPAPAGGSSWADIGFKLAEGLSNGNIKLADLGTALTPAALANPRPAPAELPLPAPPNNPRPVQVEQPSTSVTQRNAGPQNPLGIPGPMFQRLNECVITLCRRARKGDIPASAYVDFVLDEFDDLDSTGTLARSLVMDSGSLPLLEKTFPVMVPFHAWFEELLKECRNALNGPDGTTNDELPASLQCEPLCECDGSPHDAAGQESGADAGDA